MRQRRPWSQVMIACFLLAGTILLHRFGWTRPIESLFLQALSPIEASFVVWGQELHDLIFPEKPREVNSERTAELEDQVKNLVVENTRLRSLIDDLQVLEEEKQFLRDQLLEGISARVIGAGSDLARQSMLINRGSRHGVQVGAAVIAQDGFFIGKVAEVFDGTSRIVLATDASSAVAVQVQNEKQSPGIVVGEYGQTLRMDLIPQNEAIEKSQRVITSGIEPLVPKGLIVGVIRRVIDHESEVYQQAIVDPLISYERIRVVHVLLPEAL